VRATAAGAVHGVEATRRFANQHEEVAAESGRVGHHDANDSVCGNSRINGIATFGEHGEGRPSREWVGSGGDPRFPPYKVAFGGQGPTNAVFIHKV
jgi:hypothetical protein